MTTRANKSQGAVLLILAALGIIGAVIIKQHMRIDSLRNSRRNLAAHYQELSASNASLVSVEADQNDRLFRQQQQPPEVLRLRSQLTQAQQQLATAAAANQSPGTESTNGIGGYMTPDQLRFVGFDTPENGFQSLNWAAKSGDYTNWLATLAPAARDEELADPRSLELYQRAASNDLTTGWQILSSTPVGNDRVELKVRFDTKNSKVVWIYPMIAIGNEWKLGDDIHPVSGTWDSSISGDDPQPGAAGEGR